MHMLNIVFMGSADFGIPALKALLSNGHRIAAVVSTPARKKGRGRRLSDSPVTEFARENGLLPVYTPPLLKSPDFIDALKSINADIFVVVAFRLLPREVFSMPRMGTVNIHASLLPKFRGPAPIQRAIAAGEKTTGITIFKIDQGIDTGNIILQKKAEIGDDETFPHLYERLSTLGSQGLIEAVDLMQKGTVDYLKQDEALATPAPKLTKEEGKIDWRLPARTIFNMVRAFKPFPGTYAFFDGHRLHIERASIIEKGNGLPPGTICSVSGDGFDVQCGLGMLRVLEVKPEGKTVMNAKAYALGRKDLLHGRFE
jgi:methionyl-tRNA formyltransferase